MVTLAIEGSDGSELTYELNKPVIAVGASSQCDLVVRSPGVAPRHVVIQRNGDVFTFIGQNRQFVVLNGERRSRGVLRVGDRVRIGSSTLIFKGVGGDEVQVDVTRSEGPAVPREPKPQAPVTPATGTTRPELVLYSEPPRLAAARALMGEVFRSRLSSDLVTSLRTFLDSVFPERQAMLARLDEDGRLQPVASQWTGEVPRLPARTFEELNAGGRFAILRLATRQMVIYPVGGRAAEARAYLIVEGADDDDDDRTILAELAHMLAVNWDRVEQSRHLLGDWERQARKLVEERLPGTSHGIRVLREGLVHAGHGTAPVLLSGKAGSGRMTAAKLLADIHPGEPVTVEMLAVRPDADEATRVDLFGAEGRGGLVDRARSGVAVIRDVHHLPPTLQREITAVIQHDLESGYGPSVRWVATTGEDCLGLVTEGAIDPALYALFQQHTMRVPSLQERREDLPLLVVRLLDTLGAEQGKEIRGVELETLNSLVNHPFEGQMTELVAELRRLVSATPDGEMVRGLVPVTTGAGSAGDAAPSEGAAAALLSQDDLKAVIPAVERLVIDRVLRRTMGNQSKAARVLNLSRGALIAKMKEYEIPDYRYLRRGR